jgi:hypothetical protein
MLLVISVRKLAIACILCAVCFVIFDKSAITVASRYIHISHIGYHMARFLFTPRPWAPEPNYSFLIFPSLLTWLSAPFMFIGAIRLFLRRRQARLLIIYTAVITIFYSVVPVLQGPRHRLQIIPIFTLFVYEGYRWFAAQASHKRYVTYASADAAHDHELPVRLNTG